ncbi:hypothetical protein [Halostagnicola sp. A-GB9-2]|uniref:hypothetical protein n=1 Tax=Halostagnicola sp. A-GB9-2 TaxID=3048066 RepID=UPI0024BF4F9A|nr:hypothetical protein [Halostagnicola sp. A-GB9-2]MDJ1432300.1 hypothetical protein [Halostagnicola sp. A-GB9-2]
MQLEQSATETGTDTDWTDTIPSAFDARVLGLVVTLAGLAASVNVPYGGLPMAGVAFATLTVIGVVGHVLGERKLRRITDGLAERWSQKGVAIERVTRSSSGMRTQWTLHTPDGDVTVGGLALAPMSRLSIEWDGISDSMSAGEAESDLETLANGLYREIFELP